MMIEQAVARSGPAGDQHPAARAPRYIRERVNQARRACGLPAVLAVDEQLALREQLLANVEVARVRDATPGVWVDPRSRIAPRSGRKHGNGYWPASAIVSTITRVWMTPEAGTAPAGSTGRDRDERIVRGAFGLADDLNRSPGWLLRDGHGGPLLAVAGPRLRAVDTTIGLAIEWLPDPSRSDHAEVLRRIEAGAMCSLHFAKAERLVSRGVDLVTRGRLLGLAIVSSGAYRGAIARVYRDRPTGPTERQRQIGDIVSAALRAADG
jgi:hypothetical protein